MRPIALKNTLVEDMLVEAAVMAAGEGLGVRLGPEVTFELDRDVEHRDSLEAGDDDLFDALVLGVRQIGIAVLATGEGHDEAVRKAVLKLFLIFVVGTAVDLQETIDFPLHRPHLVEAIGDLLVADAFLELKHAEVSDLTHIRCSSGPSGKRPCF